MLSFSLSGSVAAGVPPAVDPPFAADTAASTPELVASFMANKSLPYESQNASAQAGPGEFIRIPGGHKHWSGGDPTECALFYQEGSGKFDLIEAK